MPPSSDRNRWAEPVELTGSVLTLDDGDGTRPSAPRRPALGPRYRLVEPVGRGAMGEVWLARDEHLGRKVAIKRMMAHSARRADHVRRFLAEMQITAQLDHPNIVPVYDMGGPADELGEHAYAMKLIRGRTLQDVLDEARQTWESGAEPDGELSLATCLDHFVRVCDAMAHAHERGVVHRDLKPANIMIGPWNEVYVMDWGIARLMGDRALDPSPEAEPTWHSQVTSPESMDPSGLTVPAGAQTRFGEALGSPAYMSPEQARAENLLLDGRSDQYSLGLILAEIVTLQRARRGEDARTVLRQARRGEWDPLVHVARRRVHPDLAAIIARATAPRPDDRYPTVAELAEDVRRFQRGEPVSARREGPLTRLARWTARHRELTLVLVMAALAVSGLVAIRSVLQVQAAEIAAQQREARLVGRISEVGAQAHRIEAGLQEYESLLTGLASAAEQLLTHGAPSPEPLFFNEDYDRAGPSDLRPSALYRQPVSFEHPVFKVAPDARRSDVEPLLRRLSPIRAHFQRMFLASGGHRSPSPAAVDTLHTLLGEQGVPLVWSYVALAEGVHTSYPGHGGYPEAYDPRVRSWYRQTAGKPGVHWGAPYPDVNGLGLILPCTTSLFAPDGRLLGVAGVELTFGVLIERLLSSDDLSARETLLLDGEGNVLVRSSEPGQAYGQGLHGNVAVSLEPYELPEIVEAARVGRSGYVERDDQLIIYQNLARPGWTYVVIGDPLS